MVDEINVKHIAHVVDGKVVNVSLWDGVTEYNSNDELIEIPDGSYAGIGWDYDGKTFVDNRPVINYFESYD